MSSPKGLRSNQPSSRSTVIGSTLAARLAGIKPQCVNR